MALKVPATASLNTIALTLPIAIVVLVTVLVAITR